VTQIDDFLRANLDQYLGELTELCAQPSVSARHEGMRECAELVAKLMARHGLAVQQIETKGNPIVVGRAEGCSKRTLLCYNHYDVQPPEPLELWTTPPFEPTIRDGALYARGAADDKGEFISRLAALDAVRSAHGGELPCTLLFVVEGEEEFSTANIVPFVQEHRDLLACDGALWEEGGIGPDGAPELVLGARGILSLELSVKTMSRDAHSGGAEALPSATWQLVRVLSSLKDENERILISGFYERARPPSDLDLQLLDNMPAFEDVYRQVYGIKDFVLERSGAALNRAVFEPTCNIQGITTGYQGAGDMTIIPAQASAKLDFRLVPDQDPQDILAKLRAHLEATGFGDVVIHNPSGMSPSKSPADSPLAQLTAETGEEVYGKPARLVPMVGGSSPMYAFVGPLGGIPVVMAGVGYWDNRTHAPDEHVRIQDFVNGTRHVARIMERFGDLKTKD
jgi:acetylornithine deacetylase/succinyl-diaminopimelate desuccinylase-like protein